MFWIHNELTLSSRFDLIKKRMQKIQFTNSNDVTVIFVDSVDSVDHDNIKSELTKTVREYTKFKSDDISDLIDLIDFFVFMPVSPDYLLLEFHSIYRLGILHQLRGFYNS